MARDPPSAQDAAHREMANWFAGLQPSELDVAATGLREIFEGY
jgi:hypothetical protein